MFKRLRRRKRSVYGAIALFTTLLILSSSLSVNHRSRSPVQAPFSYHHSALTDRVREHIAIEWQGNHALATSGGRSSGGSFGSSSGGSSSGSSSGGSSSGSSSSGSSSSSSSYSSGSSSSGSGGSSTELDPLVAFVFLLISVGFFLFLLLKQLFSRLFNPGKYRAMREEEQARLARRQEQREQANDTVTVTQVQVAMLASAREVQRDLNRIATELDWSNPEDLQTALKETLLAILRSPDTWTHVSNLSETFHTRESAKQKFDALSLEERSKFDVESLSNVNGKITRRAVKPASKESADYIVATMIVGTAHDQPLLTEPITSPEELTHGLLKTLGSLPPNYLMVYELLWSPQVESDSLTYEELLLNYPHMRQIQ